MLTSPENVSNLITHRDAFGPNSAWSFGHARARFARAALHTLVIKYVFDNTAEAVPWNWWRQCAEERDERANKFLNQKRAQSCTVHLQLREMGLREALTEN